MLQDLAQFVASGLPRGAIYALVGAFAIICSASDVINFAQGEFVMLGGMVTAFFTVTTGLLPLWLAIPAAILLTVLVGVALYRFAVAKVGGLGSRYGALAGLLLGLVEALAGGHISSGYQDAVAFLLIPMARPSPTML